MRFEVEKQKFCSYANYTCDGLETDWNESGKSLGQHYTVESCKISHCDSDMCNGANGSTWTVGSILTLPLFIPIMYSSV